MFTRGRFRRRMHGRDADKASRRWIRTEIAFLLAFAVVAGAQEELQPEHIPPNLSYSKEWRETRDHLEWKKNELGVLDHDFHQFKDFTRSDLLEASKAYVPVLAAWEKALAAFRSGSVKKALALRKEAELTKTAIDWKERLNYRKAQSMIWIDDEWARQLEAQGGRLAIKFGPQLVQAKRRASMAWGRAADAVVPGADRLKIIELTDLAHAAECNARLVEWLYHSNQDKDGVLWDARITTPEVTRVLESITATENETIELNKDLIEVDRRRRDIERRHKQSVKELAKVYADAVKALEEAKKQLK